MFTRNQNHFARSTLLTYARACLLAVPFIATTLAADTVIFRDGREARGVRTEIRGDQLTITESNGTIRTHSMREVKSIRPGPIAAVEPTKPETPPQPSTQSTRSWLDHPVSFAIQGLLPGWSGLYRSNHYAGGALMSGLELYAVARLLPWIGRPKPAIASNPALQLLLLDSFSSTANRAQTLATTPSLLRVVENPTNKSESLLREDYFRSRNERIGALAFLLVADATLSVIYRDSEQKVSIYANPDEASVGLKYSKRF